MTVGLRGAARHEWFRLRVAGRRSRALPQEPLAKQRIDPPRHRIGMQTDPPAQLAPAQTGRAPNGGEDFHLRRIVHVAGADAGDPAMREEWNQKGRLSRDFPEDGLEAGARGGI